MKKVLIVAHIGETLGHLVRGLSIADELHERGIDVVIASSGWGRKLIDGWHIKYKFHELDWKFSHNSCNPVSPIDEYKELIVNANISLRAEIATINPDLILGCPGIFTAQLARKEAIPHISILHGPYLTTISKFDNLLQEEIKVIEFCNSIFAGNCIQSIYDHLHKRLAVPSLTYQQYLQEEIVFVPQPDIAIQNNKNIMQVNYIRASFGPDLETEYSDIAQDACYITFGSGNPCNIQHLVDVAAHNFKIVFVTTGKQPLISRPKNVIAFPFISSKSLAGKVGTVISHGGIGTVGTFSEFGTRQIIIPTEIDQAVMAVHARRNQLAEVVGLLEWTNNLTLGRNLPQIDESRLNDTLKLLADRPPVGPSRLSNGAVEIAMGIITFLGGAADELLMFRRNVEAPSQFSQICTQ